MNKKIEKKLEKNIGIDLLKDQIITKNKPLLGICVGMQILFENSDIIQFLWNSSDLDDNILEYDVYLGSSIDNLTKIGDKISQTSFDHQLSLNTNYFWEVITIDQQGNESISGINQFQTEP